MQTTEHKAGCITNCTTGPAWSFWFDAKSARVILHNISSQFLASTKLCKNTKSISPLLQIAGAKQTEHVYKFHDLSIVVLGFYVPPTAKVIRRRDLDLKSHPKDTRSQGSNS